MVIAILSIKIRKRILSFRWTPFHGGRNAESNKSVIGG
jgi:hypothetical protein